MDYLSSEELQKLTPHRRKALLKSVHKKLEKSIKVRKEFAPDIAILLCPTATRLNAYLSRIKKLVKDGNDTGSVSQGSSGSSSSDEGTGS